MTTPKVNRYRLLIVFIWIAIMLLATILNELNAVDLPPTLLSELIRIGIHGFGFAILGLAIRWEREGLGTSAFARRVLLVALIVGVIMEIIQSFMRAHVTLGGSAFDLVVDLVGALSSYLVTGFLSRRLMK